MCNSALEEHNKRYFVKTDVEKLITLDILNKFLPGMQFFGNRKLNYGRRGYCNHSVKRSRIYLQIWK